MLRSTVSLFPIDPTIFLSIAIGHFWACEGDSA